MSSRRVHRMSPPTAEGGCACAGRGDVGHGCRCSCHIASRYGDEVATYRVSSLESSEKLSSTQRQALGRLAGLPIGRKGMAKGEREDDDAIAELWPVAIAWSGIIVPTPAAHGPASAALVSVVGPGTAWPHGAAPVAA